MTPRFSATNTWPSAAKRTAVGFFSPLKAVTSVNPDGTAAWAGDSGLKPTTTAAEAISTMDAANARIRWGAAPEERRACAMTDPRFLAATRLASTEAAGG